MEVAVALTPVEIRHISFSRSLLGYSRSGVDRLLEDIVEVAAVQDDIGVVGAEGGLADLQGSLVVGAGAGQIAPGRLVLQPVDRYLVGQGPGPAEQTRP